MPWAIPPDSLIGAIRTTANADPGGHATLPGPGATEFALVEATRAYLACLARSGAPRPELISAWDEFYRVYTPPIVRLVRRRCGSAGDADDRVQDVWQAIVARLAVFRPDPARGPFLAWLLTVARRRLVDCHRGDARNPRPMTWDEPPDQIQGRQDDPALSCERDEERALVAGLLAELQAQVTPLSYRVLQLRSLEGRTVSEVARLVGLTADQVRARHHRMVAKLRRLADPAGQRDFAMTR